MFQSFVMKRSKLIMWACIAVFLTTAVSSVTLVPHEINFPMKLTNESVNYQTGSENIQNDDGISEDVLAEEHPSDEEKIIYYCKPVTDLNPSITIKNFNGPSHHESTRHKRSTKHILPKKRILRVLVAVDQSMKDFHGNNLREYIRWLFHYVTVMLKHLSSEYEVCIAISNTEEFKPAENSIRKNGYDYDKIGPDFEEWQRIKAISTGDFDTAIFLTRKDLVTGDEATNKTLGFATLKTLCRGNSAYGVVQDSGEKTASTLGHEIGHIFGINHDDEKECKYINTEKRREFIMNAFYRKEEYLWSECSKRAFVDFLRDYYLPHDCLSKLPSRDYELLINSETRLKASYDLKEQCQVFSSPVHKNTCQKDNKPIVLCNDLQCNTGTNDKFCVKTENIWADYTTCGKDERCFRGKCLSQKILEFMNENWGSWGTCSRSCGGGVQKRQRSCEKSEDSGYQCSGISTQYKSCNTQECRDDSGDFREKQIVGDARLGDEKYPCGIFHKGNSKLLKFFIDGTNCDQKTSDMCVEGVCQKAGCDHELGSDAALDICGICNGDGTTCRKISGTYNYTHSDKKLGRNGRYYQAVKIPKHSSSIKFTPSSGKVRNVIALRAQDKYILDNGNEQIPKDLNIRLQYSVNQEKGEVIFIQGPIKVDMKVEVIVNKANGNPQIWYEYYVPDNNARFEWTLGKNFTDCDRLCNGTQHKETFCQNLSTNATVKHEYCRTQPEPISEEKTCNMNCRLRWRNETSTPCVDENGNELDGIAKYQCIKEIFSSNETVVVVDFNCHHIYPYYFVCPGPPFYTEILNFITEHPFLVLGTIVVLIIVVYEIVKFCKRQPTI